MRKRSSVDFRGSNELSRLVTREWLDAAGVPKTSQSEVADPDLDEIFKRIRAVRTTPKTKSKRPAIKRSLIRKLVRR